MPDTVVQGKVGVMFPQLQQWEVSIVGMVFPDTTAKCNLKLVEDWQLRIELRKGKMIETLVLTKDGMTVEGWGKVSWEYMANELAKIATTYDGY